MTKEEFQLSTEAFAEAMLAGHRGRQRVSFQLQAHDAELARLYRLFDDAVMAVVRHVASAGDRHRQAAPTGHARDRRDLVRTF